MKLKMKRAAVIVISAAAVLISACAAKDEEATAENTSSGLDIYIAEMQDGTLKAVDGEGNKLSHYSVDEAGNITEGERILIKTENTEEYRYITAIVPLNPSESYETELPVIVKPGTVTETENTPVTVEYRFYVSPSNASNPVLRIRSSDSKTAAIKTEDGEKTETEIRAGDGIATFYLLCARKGTAAISVTAGDGSGITADFEVTVNEAEPEMNNSVIQNEDEIPTTESSRGWIDARNVRFRKSPSSDAEILDIFTSGEGITILGADETGWTKCIFEGKAGYVKTDYVTRIKPEETSRTEVTRTPVLSGTSVTATPTPSEIPPRANDGNDHGNAYGMQRENELKNKSDAANAVNHTHYYRKSETVPATASEKGYTVYSCGCGKSYRVYKDE